MRIEKTDARKLKIVNVYLLKPFFADFIDIMLLLPVGNFELDFLPVNCFRDVRKLEQDIA